MRAPAAGRMRPAGVGACTDPNSLLGVVVLITGGSRGIGRAMAIRFAADGAQVGLLARSKEGLEETLAMIDGAGATAVADVTDQASVERACERLMAALGPVDVLVNNAGVSTAMGETWDVDPERWWHNVEVNLRGMYLPSRAVLP